MQETWTDDGHPYFVFAPINACSGCSGKIYLLEQMSGSLKQSDLGPTHQVVLVYDDTEPFTTFTPMPYCLQDPRGAGNTLLATGVLPADATSCIVEGHQTVVGDGTVANAKVNFAFIVYTSYDGSRGGPNPAALAVIADALHEALCLLQRVGGIRLTTLQLGEGCEGP